MVTNKDTLKPAYSAKCEGIIWKIILDENKKIIVWECRTKDKKVSFYAYDFKNQVTLLHNFKFDDDWELSINTVKDGILYFNGHESDFSPVQKGLLAFDLQTKKIIWQNFSISAQLFCNDGIIIFDTKILPRKYRLIAYETGQQLSELNVGDLANYRGLNNTIILPSMTEAKDIIDTTYLLTFNNLNICSYYQKKGEAIDQYIRVEKNGEILMTEILNEQIQKISFDTFFVWHNHLFYIKNKTEIVSYFV
ncbi:DUF4905 domain-containing protein [Pedobacter arcticus]|uniref:DUF4905 domain-containing protein n=1 Tax=Pedobacter arcticus TaxID=752140 RepID=UPI0002ECA208|nr:DUF4905 domain-containing protein [Pedobacter arcticus]